MDGEVEGRSTVDSDGWDVGVEECSTLPVLLNRVFLSQRDFDSGIESFGCLGVAEWVSKIGLGDYFVRVLAEWVHYRVLVKIFRKVSKLNRV